MLSHHQIAAATRIGMLTRERDTVSACSQALEELGRALPLDLATLLSIDPLTGEHVQVAGIGYTAETSQALAAEFVDTPGIATSSGRTCRLPSPRTPTTPASVSGTAGSTPSGSARPACATP